MAVACNFVPTGGDARPGVDFDFLPWHPGRAALNLSAAGYHPDRMAVLTAKQELILSVAAPSTWVGEHPSACAEIYHVRKAIPRMDNYAVCTRENLYLCSWTRMALRRSEAPEHQVRGGLLNMVVYPELEVVVPNYFFDAESPTGDRYPQMHGFILRKEAVAEHRERGRQLTPRRDKETGEIKDITIKLPCPTGMLRTVDPTPKLRIVLDEAGVIFQIHYEGKRQNAVTLGNGEIRMTVGTIPTDNRVRERLGLPLLEVVGTILDSIVATPSRATTGKVTVGEALSRAVTATVKVERRAKPPKLPVADATSGETEAVVESAPPPLPKAEVVDLISKGKKKTSEPAAVQASASVTEPEVIAEPAALPEPEPAALPEPEPVVLPEPEPEPEWSPEPEPEVIPESETKTVVLMEKNGKTVEAQECVSVQPSLPHTTAPMEAAHPVAQVTRKEVLALLASFIAEDIGCPGVRDKATGEILFPGGPADFETTKEYIQWMQCPGAEEFEPET
jgi:hypothetical protein